MFQTRSLLNSWKYMNDKEVKVFKAPLVPLISLVDLEQGSELRNPIDPAECLPPF